MTIVFSACVPYKKSVVLDGDRKNPLDTSKFYQHRRPQYKLQINDIVDIKISSKNLEALKYFSKDFSDAGVNAALQIGMAGGDIYYMSGYIVGDDGTISMPTLGDMPALGLTIPQLRDSVKQAIGQYFLEDYYYVDVKLGGIRYAVLGEVNSPGQFVALQNQITIFEALAKAGDVGTFAKRDEVIVIRQYPDGTKNHKINLLTDDIFESDFYFIRPNDQILVLPMRIKVLGLGDNLIQNTLTFLALVVTIGSLTQR